VINLDMVYHTMGFGRRQIKVDLFYQAVLRCIMPKKQSRHMVRADNKTQTSISVRADLLELAKEEAAKEGRSLSNWLEQELRRKFDQRPTSESSEARPNE
jgi:hypothetical protein